MDILLLLLGALLLLGGLIGCILPILPGPPVSFLGVLAIWWARDFEASSFGATTVLVLGLSALIVTILDYLLPVWGAKRGGATRGGVWGSLIGMIVGTLFFPPLGCVLGALVGALAFELMAGRDFGPALRASWGVFVGTVAGILVKLVVSIACIVKAVQEVL